MWDHPRCSCNGKGWGCLIFCTHSIYWTAVSNHSYMNWQNSRTATICFVMFKMIAFCVRDVYTEVMCQKSHIYIIIQYMHSDKDYCFYCWDTAGYSKCHIWIMSTKGNANCTYKKTLCKINTTIDGQSFCISN